jgi:ABC-2 type transport system permease protein
MLRNVAFIAAHEAKSFLREREVYFFSFAMPLAFMYFIGTITSQFSGGTGAASKDPIALERPASAGFLADQLVERLEQNGLVVQRPESPEAAATYARRIVVPEHFTERVLRGETATVKFLRNDEGLSADYDQFRVRRAVYTLLADLAVDALADKPLGAAAFDRIHKMPRALTLEVQPAGQRKVIPTGFEQAVPGIMIMFTLMALLSNGAVSLVIQRERGLLRRLASAPLTRGEIFAGKWAGLLVLGVAQIAFCMLVGTLLFGMDWGPELPMILTVLVAWGGLCASFGMLLGNLVRTEGQGIGISVLATNALAALGGLWWPIEVAPGWMQRLAAWLPTAWAMDAIHQLVSFRAGAFSACPQLAALLVATLVVGWLGIRTLRLQ